MEAPDLKTVLITGCSSGFGRGMIDEFLDRGWLVIATMRDADDRREQLQDLLSAHPKRLKLLPLDVTDPWERSAVLSWLREHGRLDALVNNAGFGLFGALEDLTEEQLRRQFEVNFFGAALLTRACLPLLRASKGSIVFISSAFGLQGFPLTSAYCASKFALEGFAESLFYELEPHDVHVSLIEPGANKTKFGTSVVWGEGSKEAFQEQTNGYKRLKEGLSARSKDGTLIVARRTADLAEKSLRKLRVRVGSDAAWGHVFRELVPDLLRLPLTTRMFRKLFLGKSKA